MHTNQQKDYQYFIDNKKKLLKEYPNKYVVIKGNVVIGAFEDRVEAFTETTKSHKEGTFIIQRAVPESTNTQVFHSRVIDA